VVLISSGCTVKEIVTWPLPGFVPFWTLPRVGTRSAARPGLAAGHATVIDLLSGLAEKKSAGLAPPGVPDAPLPPVSVTVMAVVPVGTVKVRVAPEPSISTAAPPAPASNVLTLRLGHTEWS